ncbi:DUF6287 domain-containing protein [Streptococcus sp. S784/96/1]|uniref:DUF6287 domain-containing protein n=1 Tax=Streptococcus sp. S784/96/1 TaxID=2653499 RepID=UPI00138A1BEF|nr:DUF6287 domain-containing protein [Streptococcus sp. S784/96/1]
MSRKIQLQLWNDILYESKEKVINKMKKFLLGLILISSITLTACQNKTNEKTSVSKESKVTTTTETTASTTATPKVDESLYQTIIDQYATAIGSNTVNQELNPLAVTYASVYDTATGYAYHDFDKNGIRELVIGFLPSKIIPAHTVTDIYTITKDNQLVRVTSKELNLDMIGERMTLWPLADGNFIYAGSSGDGYRWSATGDKLEKIDTPTSTERFDLSSLEWTSVIKEAEPQVEVGSSVDVNALVAGDYASLAGTWTNAKGDVLVIDTRGNVTNKESNRIEVRTISENGQASGSYIAGMTGANISIFPVGVSLTNFANPEEVDISDTSKERIFITQSFRTPEEAANEMYYRQ